MPVIGVQYSGGLLSLEDFYRLMQDPLRPFDYSPEILDKMVRDEFDEDAEPGIESHTPSRILGCLRQSVLQPKADYYVNIDHSFPMERGNVVHAYMEGARYRGALKAIREKRMRVEVPTKYGPQLFTAKPDVVYVLRVATEEGAETPGGPGESRTVFHVGIKDYKSKGDIGHDLVEADYKHQLQVNMYAYMVRRCLPALLGLPDARVVVDWVEVDYLTMKKQRIFTSVGPRTARGKRLTTKPTATYETLTLAPVRLWADEQVHRFIVKRIEERIHAREELPPRLEGDDAWMCARCPVQQWCFSLPNHGAKVE